MKQISGLKVLTLSAALVAAGAASTANASAMAQAILNIEGLVFTDGAGGVLSAGVFDVLDGNNNGSTSAGLTGYGSDGSGPLSNSLGLALGDAFTCLGGSCPIIANNDFTIQSAPPAGHGASSDFLTSGVAISGLPTAESVGVDASTRADVWVTGEAVGESDTNTGTTASLIFTLASSLDVGISFDASAFLSAFVDPGSRPGTFAQSTITWGITISNAETQETVFQWNPDGRTGGITGGTEISDAFSLNTTRSRNAVFTGETCAPVCGSGFNTGSFAAVTTLAAGGYELSISQVATADAAMVPEPAGLALIGIGLLAAGAVGRRKVTKA